MFLFLPRDIQLEIVKRFDMDARIKAGIVHRLRVPRRLADAIGATRTCVSRGGDGGVTVRLGQWGEHCRYCLVYSLMFDLWEVFEMSSGRVHVQTSNGRVWRSYDVPAMIEHE